MAKKEIEKDVLASFERQRLSLTQSMMDLDKDKYQGVRYGKIPYYFNRGEMDWGLLDIIDYAIWDFDKGKFIAVEYPWRLKNGEIRYNRIKLC